MMSVSTKLTLLVLVLPIGVLLFLTPLIFYMYSVDVFPFISVVWVLFIPSILIVWGKIRDSASGKVEYLHKNFLFKLYSGFGHDHDLFFSKDGIRRARIDLETYGRFIVIPLYPTKLLERIDEFIFLHDTFYGKLQQISEMAEKKLGKKLYDRGKLWHYLGFEPVSYSAPSSEEEKQYIQMTELLVKKQFELINETKNLHEKIKRLRKQIYEKIEDFLKSNNLRLEEEPAYIPSPY